MKILMVTPMLPYPEATAAGPLVMYHQLAALREQHAVSLVTFAGPDRAERSALDHLRSAGIDLHCVWRDAPHGLERWRRRGRLASGWLRGIEPLRTLEFADHRLQALIDQRLATGSFALVQVEDNAMGAYHYPEGLPLMLTEHEVREATRDTPATLPLRLLQTIEQRKWRRYQPAIWRRFDRIQVFTAHDAEALGRLAPALRARVRVNPFGITLPPEGDPAMEEDATLLFVGNFAHPPNSDAALWLGKAILPRVLAQWPAARLQIVGAQPPATVRELAVTDAAITVTGYVPTIDPYIARATLVLAPLRQGGGMRLKVLQALAAGKAVVATSLAAEGLAVDDERCALPLVIADDAESFASAIVHLLATPDERHALGMRARRFVMQHHTWSAYARRLAAIYAEVLTTAGAGR